MVLGLMTPFQWLRLLRIKYNGKMIKIGFERMQSCLLTRYYPSTDLETEENQKIIPPG
jgi:hypothetical protein